MENILQGLVTVSGPLLFYLFDIWTAGLDDLRSATARRLIVLGLVMVSVLIIVAVEASVEDFGRQVAWHIIGLLAVAVLAWGAKMLVKRRELEQR